MMIRQIVLNLVFVVGLLGIFDRADAQDPYLRQLYGRGVHAYYSGDYINAQKHLDDAIRYGINDPRAYYFRGLTKAHNGNSYDAESDYRMAATLEVRGAGTYDIGHALIRIQGHHRLELEKIRRDVLISFRGQRPAMPDTFSTEPMLPAEPLLPSGPPAGLVPDPIADEPDSEVDPFADEPDSEVDPFGGDDAAAEVDDLEEDPFGVDEADADEDPFGVDKADADEDPFGGDEAADEDPFGVDEADADEDPFGVDEAADEDPFGVDEADADEDPFGGDEAADEDPFGVDEAADEDPFGGDEAADEDPFGGDEADDDIGAADEAADDKGADAGEDPFADEAEVMDE